MVVSARLVTKATTTSFQLERRHHPKEAADPCAGEPCMNGGSCIPKGAKFQCLCSKGFEGATCEQRAKSYCHPNPCLHGGTCIDQKDGYFCRCIGSYRGTNCEVDDCDQCDIHAISVEGACRCRIGYKGDAFECEKINRCHRCSPNATYINNECVCKPGFIGSGKHCQPYDCKGCPPHSHCIRGICICIPGYFFDGHHCVATVHDPWMKSRDWPSDVFVFFLFPKPLFQNSQHFRIAPQVVLQIPLVP